MRPRVNLLPREAEQREALRRAWGALAAAGLVLLLVIGAIYFVQVSRVRAANTALERAQADRDRLQQQVRGLQEYADLEGRRNASVDLLKKAMANDVTLAGVLQDFAAVIPNEAALTALTVTVGTPQSPGGTAAAPAGGAAQAAGPAFGKITGSGETLRGHAPGVERFLLEMEKVAAFFNVYLSTSTIDPQGVAVFSFEAELGPEIFTRRYADGLPKELR